MNGLKGWFAVLTGLALISCAKGPSEGSAPDPATDAAANRWIYSQMIRQYLYNDYTKTVTPDYNQSCENFFTGLLSSRPTDNDGKHTGTDNYFYSSMERSGASKTAVSGKVATYGIEYKCYYTDYSRTYVAARVQFVVKGSPADRAGIRRGDWICLVDGKPIGSNNTSVLRRGGAVTLWVERMEKTMQDGFEIYRTVYEKSVSMGAAEVLDVSPVLADTLIVRGSRRIGYLVYNEFLSEPDGTSDGRYDEQLKAVFADFKRQQVNELVLDLRYNGGGYVNTCRLLCSMIAPQSALGQVFCIERFNDDLHALYGETVLRFLPEGEVGGCNLNLARLYVLTGPWTASSSELVINNLRPYMPVKVVGTTTEGKNVGSSEIRSNVYGIVLRPITGRAFNRDYESDYANGFDPDFPADDDDNQDQMFELGDPDEFVLQYALADITGLPAAASSKAGVSQKGPYVPAGEPQPEGRVRGMIFTAPGETNAPFD